MRGAAIIIAGPVFRGEQLRGNNNNNARWNPKFSLSRATTEEAVIFHPFSLTGQFRGEAGGSTEEGISERSCGFFFQRLWRV